MADIKTGGAAFPCEGGSDSGLFADPGMTLRDYFAGQYVSEAVKSLYDMEDDMFIQFSKRLGETAALKMAAKLAYELADAMIAAREGGAK